MTNMAHTLRRGRKFNQVLDGARTIFLRDGFEGANVDDIAREAGVSKATLYNYFTDKRLLFVEVAQNECCRLAERTLDLIDDTRPPQEVLRIAARQIVPFLLSDFAQKVFRICMSERERFPELGRNFYEAGPKMGREKLVEYMGGARDRGDLVIDDLEMAAEQFSELCRVRLWARAVFGIQNDFSQDEIDYVVENAVETFMARYGA